MLRTTAAHMCGDKEEWLQLARDLNTHQALYRSYWEDKISADFSCTITVGVNGETKELANSTEYFDWLQESRSAAYLLMSCIDVMALTNMNIDIIIHENGLSPAIQKYEPDLEFPWKEEDPMKPRNLNVKKQRKMTVLNHKNVHFNLIVGPKQMLSQVGSLRFQQTQFPLDPEGLVSEGDIKGDRSLQGEPAPKAQILVGSPSKLGTPADGGHGLVGGPAHLAGSKGARQTPEEEVFLADEGRWENMGLVQDTREDQEVEDKQEEEQGEAWHKVQKQGNRFRCPTCGFTRNTKHQIEKNLNKHKEEAEDGDYTCMKCSFQHNSGQNCIFRHPNL